MSSHGGGLAARKASRFVRRSFSEEEARSQSSRSSRGSESARRKVTKIATSPCCQCGSLWAVFSMSPRGSKNFMIHANRGERGHCLNSFALRAACGWLSPLRFGSCPLFEVAAKPRREEAEQAVIQDSSLSKRIFGSSKRRSCTPQKSNTIAKGRVPYLACRSFHFLARKCAAPDEQKSSNPAA